MKSDVFRQRTIEGIHSTEYSIENKDILTSYIVTPKKSENFCVGIVDMVNSTKISASLSNGKISLYYQVFLNSMSEILSRFGGFVVKNVGDCLFYYFPESAKIR